MPAGYRAALFINGHDHRYFGGALEIRDQGGKLVLVLNVLLKNCDAAHWILFQILPHVCVSVFFSGFSEKSSVSGRTQNSCPTFSRKVIVVSFASTASVASSENALGSIAPANAALTTSAAARFQSFLIAIPLQDKIMRSLANSPPLRLELCQQVGDVQLLLFLSCHIVDDVPPRAS